MLKNLKFFKAYTEEDRAVILRKAFYRQMKAQEYVFKQGDISDKMYIIIKGRVSVEV